MLLLFFLFFFFFSVRWIFANFSKCETDLSNNCEYFSKGPNIWKKNQFLYFSVSGDFFCTVSCHLIPTCIFVPTPDTLLRIKFLLNWIIFHFLDPKCSFFLNNSLFIFWRTFSNCFLRNNTWFSTFLSSQFIFWIWNSKSKIFLLRKDI